MIDPQKVQAALAGRLFPAELFMGKPRFEKLTATSGGQDPTFTLGGSDVEFKLKKTGYAEALVLRVRGQTDVTTAALVLMPRAPWNIFSKALIAPSGSRQNPVNCDLSTIHYLNQFQRLFSPYALGRFDVRTDGLDVNTGRSALLESFPLGVANDQAFELWYVIPLRRSATDLRGMLPVGNESDTVLKLTPNTEANMVTVVGNWAQDSLNVECWQISRDPAPHSAPGDEIQIDPYPAAHIVTVEEFAETLRVGDNPLVIQPGGQILQVVVVIALNDLMSTSDDLSSISVRVDRDYIFPPNTDPRIVYFWQNENLRFRLPDGVLAFDFDRHADADGAAARFLGAGFAPSEGQWLHTDEGVNEVEINVAVATGTALGTTPRAYVGVRRFEELA